DNNISNVLWADLPFSLDDFCQKWQEFLLDLNIQRKEEDNKKVFSALVALTLTFPLRGKKTDWELLQTPIGIFSHGDQTKFVSGGACALVKKRFSFSAYHA